MSRKPKVTIAEISKRTQAKIPKRRHDLNTPTCLVIDGMNVAYQAYYAYNNLSFKGKSTSIMFGMPSILRSIMQQYPSEKVVICWDGRRSAHRLAAWPQYKEHRPGKKADFKSDLKRTRILLKHLGITQCLNPELEGDDMIYWVTKKMSKIYRVVIVTADKDMHQLINNDVQVYNPRSKQPYGTFAFICDNFCELHQYVDFLCLTGDKSDDIPGYRGIGPQRAKGFLDKYPSIKEYLADEDAEYSGLNDKDELKRIYDRNKLLIDLEYFNKKFHTEKDILYYKDKNSPPFNEEKLRTLSVKYGLKTFLSATFQKPFKDLHQ